MSRRVRRDSETSTDSWSLVEEDRLDDDFSLTSTDNEGVELEAEPIIEEPPTSDEEEEEEDTASEKSLDSESEDSEDEDSELSAADGSDVEEEVEEDEDEVGIQEVSDDSDLSDAESDASENSDEEEEEEEEDAVEMEEEDQVEAEMEAARKCKEDEHWMDELEEDTAAQTRRSCRMLLAFSMFLMLFPLADIFTSWILTYQNHRSMSSFDHSKLIFDGYSLQSYNSERGSYVWKSAAEESHEERDKKWRRQQKSNRNNLHLLKNILNRPKKSVPMKSFEILEVFTNKTFNWRMQSNVFEKKSAPKIVHVDVATWISAMSHSENISIAIARSAKCRALAPIPPAPFTPRRLHKTHKLPRHQPCFVHVNQSKWTCQKNVPSVIYPNTSPNFTVMPRGGFQTMMKKKGMGKTSQLKDMKMKNNNISAKYDICGKKASESMRTTPKPTDQCHTRQLSKFTPRRKHIAYKAPLPCKVPTYKPTTPKKSSKPSTSDDWLQKRSHHRAQLRSRA